MTIKHLAYRLAHEFGGGAVALASLMGKGEKVLQNKLNPNSETHYLNIDELEMLADFTSGNKCVADYFAQKANAAVVLLPNDDVVTGDMSMLEAFMEVTTQDGTFSYEFKRAWDDGRITVAEFERLEKIQFESIGKRLALLAEIRRVVR